MGILSLETSIRLIVIITMIYLFALAITAGMKATKFEKITTSNTEIIDKDTSLQKNATIDLSKINSVLLPEISSNKAICAFSVLLILLWITLFVFLRFFFWKISMV